MGDGERADTLARSIRPRPDLQGIEDQLAILSEKAGVPYTRPGSSAPAEVKQLVGAGDRMGAIKKYRELTGAGLDEAQAVIAEL